VTLLNDELRAAIAERMNRLQEVAWDRCVLHAESGVAYGWIARTDGHFDFVLLDFSWGETTGLAGERVHWLAVGFTTSSAFYSREIDRRLRGTDAGHVDCSRVEDVFGALVERRCEFGR
jgi:hypothetical protein